MFKGRSREKIALMVGGGVGFAYILLSWLMISAWQESLHDILEGPTASALSRDFPLLLRLFMLPVPAVAGSGVALWPFIVQGLFISGALAASILRPQYITWAVLLAVLFVLLFLISGAFLVSLYSTFAFGIPMTGLIALAGLEVSKRIRISKTTGYF